MYQKYFSQQGAVKETPIFQLNEVGFCFALILFYTYFVLHLFCFTLILFYTYQWGIQDAQQNLGTLYPCDVQKFACVNLYLVLVLKQCRIWGGEENKSCSTWSEKYSLLSLCMAAMNVIWCAWPNISGYPPPRQYGNHGTV